MKYLYSLTSLLILAILVFVGAIFYEKKVDIVSPLPYFLTHFVNDQVRTLNLWIPSSIYALSFDDDLKRPDISAKSALVYDITEDKIIYEKNPKDKLPMASITKIMTAVVGIENYNENREFNVIRDDLVGENAMGLSEDETLSFIELLYGLILPSGNDAAETLSRGVLGGRDEYIRIMNDRAKALGALNTNFTNPSGLQGDGDQYTTAYDMLILTKHAMKLPLFRTVVGTVEYNIPETNQHKEFYLYNETNLLTSYPGIVGVKTGFTPEAGNCLVSFLSYEGHEIIGIILGSENRRDEMIKLLDYSLEIQGIEPPKIN